MNINEIYIEAHRSPDVLAALVAKEFICCDESTDRMISLLQISTLLSPAVKYAVEAKDGEFFEVLKCLAALHFEAGRLYGRQEIVDETLRGIK